MAELKATKTKDGIALSGELPQDILSSPKLEIFHLKGGIYLLAAAGAVFGALGARGEGSGDKAPLSNREKEVVQKLLAIRFEKRTPSEAARALTREENGTLSALISRGAVQLFHNPKYRDEGVYNISDSAFNAVRESVPAPAELRAALPVFSPEHLEKRGWMVLETEAEAKNFAAAYSERVKSGEMRGVRAFDHKFYFVTKKYAGEWEKKVQLSLAGGEKSPQEIAAELGMESGGCSALLFHMCDSGDVMERKKGKFARA